MSSEAGEPAARVLIASADLAFSAALQDSLATQGIDSQIVADPRDDAELARKVALTDVLLIEAHAMASGEWEIIGKVRTHNRLIEVILISSDLVLEEVVEVLRGAVFSVLEYPVSSSQLVQEIKLACARKRHGEERMRQLSAHIPRG